MRITKIEQQKKNNKRYNIYLDGEYHSSIEKEILEELNFHEGMELNADEFDDKLVIINYKSALRASLNMLTHTSRTKSELKKKLKEKQYPETAINSVLDYLSEIGYVNDESYAESFIRNNKEVTGTSRRSIYYKLAGKGIDNEIIQQKLEEAAIDDYAAAIKAARKKVASLKGDKRERTSKLLSFLYRKGFSIETCKKVIDELGLDEV